MDELLTLGITGGESVSRGVRQLVSTYEDGDGSGRGYRGHAAGGSPRVVWRQVCIPAGILVPGYIVSILIAVLKSVQTRIHHFDAGFFGQAATQTRATTRVAPTSRGSDVEL